MRKVRIAVWSVVTMVGIASGAHLASAQEYNAAGAPPAAKRAGPPFTVEVRPYDMKALANAPTPPEDVHRGRAIWLQRCAYCHDGVGQPSYNTLGPWIGAETVTKYTEEGVKAFVSVGTDRMPGFAHTLKPAQMNDIVAFLKTRGDDTKPTAAQLTGKAPGQQSAD
jgi:mono/diheme cytochrome c family protein